ncbi:hypothetical protein AM493_04300 [Flavobacterium akiainvivens]|uniref:Gliding motility-associated protein GldM C-terminal domain-containing protein n=1 Tax=Flavobacterium akiainvivens TaxID=1202724 RepID=A0A0M8MGK5_9FLAO|nr:GldM family protein [Flavobacterium akiainvivens]KOS05337.1 hypothetical protein AM493_04300 [Flavobacterium akiainvivens]SFQ76680.1 hypothetical protein SAMN05444144_12414 [Flavobacterium akiainvivens]
MKYILFLLISVSAFAQNASNVTASSHKVLINGQSMQDDVLKFTREQLKEAVVTLDPAANLPEKTHIACFELTFPEKPRHVIGGNKVLVNVHQAISRLKSGDTVIIQNIKYQVPGDKTWHKYTGSQKIMIVE